MVPQRYFQILSFLHIVYPENFMCIAQAIKKFEFWNPRLRRTPIVEPPNFGKRYIFYIYLRILRILSV